MKDDNAEKTIDIIDKLFACLTEEVIGQIILPECVCMCVCVCGGGGY